MFALPQDVLHSILSSPGSVRRINDVLPDGLTLGSVGTVRPIFQATASSRIAIIVWSSVGAAIGLVLVTVGGLCIANYSRLVLNISGIDEPRSFDSLH